MLTVLVRHPEGFWTLSSFSDSESEIKESIRDLVFHGISTLDILVLDHVGTSKYMIPHDLPKDRYKAPKRESRIIESEPKMTKEQKEWYANIPD